MKEGGLESLTYNRFWAKEKGRQPTPGPVNTIFETSGKTMTRDNLITAVRAKAGDRVTAVELELGAGVEKAQNGATA